MRVCRSSSLLGTKVFLELFVKVQSGWRDSRDFVEETDWRRQLENISDVQRAKDPQANDDKD